VVKVGTSLWALDRLGPEHQYHTEFGFTESLDARSGVLQGALVVRGGGDPDFHVENAFMVASELNRLGVRTVTGDMWLTGEFWIGWENGVERRIMDPGERARVMGERLRRAFDPVLWDAPLEGSWQGLCDRRGWDEDAPPRVQVRGRATFRPTQDFQPLLVHRSNPLSVLLKRFNTYSNNDLIRVADGLGGVVELESFLRGRLGVGSDALELSTASGQGRNRMTARAVVGLMRSFEAALGAAGLGMDDVLPVPGCDPGPTRRMFPRLAAGEFERAATVKTGTLTTTDGGVVVLAGSFQSPRLGQVLFCVAAPRTGRDLTRWRRLEQAWLVDLIESAGGADPVACSGELPFSDAMAIVEATRPVRSDSSG
jgi:D-alanyl-D-alanine carboxypeptidase/D-alanyl-D-alanine-endopeptidase (penicillin-binding protein 4)